MHPIFAQIAFFAAACVFGKLLGNKWRANEKAGTKIVTLEVIGWGLAWIVCLLGLAYTSILVSNSN